jgi:hypothetical protein
MRDIETGAGDTTAIDARIMGIVATPPGEAEELIACSLP